MEAYIKHLAKYLVLNTKIIIITMELLVNLLLLKKIINKLYFLIKVQKIEKLNKKMNKIKALYYKLNKKLYPKLMRNKLIIK